MGPVHHDLTLSDYFHRGLGFRQAHRFGRVVCGFYRTWLDHHGDDAERVRELELLVVGR